MPEKPLKRAQHILAECYLKRWIDPASIAVKPKQVVWVNSKDGERQFPRNPGQRPFWSDFFYDITTKDGKRDQSMEDALQDIEARFARLMDKQIERREPLDRDQVRVLDLFLVSMFVRTQKFREFVESPAAKIAEMERAEAQLRGSDDPLIDLRQKNIFPFAIAWSWTWMADKLAGWEHNLVLAPNGKFFITSDTPCVWHADIGPLGLENRWLEITLPLSPRHLLLLSRTMTSSNCGETSCDMVDYFNWRTIRGCREYWVSCNKLKEAAWFESELYWFAHFLGQKAANPISP